jgi:hypothetical protein
MQRENLIKLAALDVGDSMELPAIRWDLNHEGKAVYEAAMTHSAQTGKQFEIRNGERYATSLHRIR